MWLLLMFITVNVITAVAVCDANSSYLQRPEVDVPLRGAGELAAAGEVALLAVASGEASAPGEVAFLAAAAGEVTAAGEVAFLAAAAGEAAGVLVGAATDAEEVAGARAVELLAGAAGVAVWTNVKLVVVIVAFAMEPVMLYGLIAVLRPDQ